MTVGPTATQSEEDGAIESPASPPESTSVSPGWCRFPRFWTFFNFSVAKKLVEYVRRSSRPQISIFLASPATCVSNKHIVFDQCESTTMCRWCSPLHRTWEVRARARARAAEQKKVSEKQRRRFTQDARTSQHDMSKLVPSLTFHCCMLNRLSCRCWSHCLGLPNLGDGVATTPPTTPMAGADPDDIGSRRGDGVQPKFEFPPKVTINLKPAAGAPQLAEKYRKFKVDGKHPFERIRKQLEVWLRGHIRDGQGIVSPLAPTFFLNSYLSAASLRHQSFCQTSSKAESLWWWLLCTCSCLLVFVRVFVSHGTGSR
jgi:hypothetical protein